MVKDIFEQLAQPGFVDEPKKESPTKPEKILRGPLLQPIVPPATQNDPPLERMLDFLVNHWRQPTIDVRSIMQYGPRPRSRKKALDLTEILVANGWLEPLDTHRRDRRVWRIARGPDKPNNPKWLAAGQFPFSGLPASQSHETRENWLSGRSQSRTHGQFP
jgi:hypothetical protein